MPDPHKDLAGIIEPVAPPLLVTTDPTPAWLGVGALLLILAFGWWGWRRRAYPRTLRRLANASDITTATADLARLTRDRAAPESWRLDLERLRFARPTPDAAATLARLCREAEAMLRAGKGKA